MKDLKPFILTGIILIILFTPCFSGGISVLSISIIEFIIFSSMALWGIDTLFFSKKQNIEIVKTPLNLFIIIILFFIIFQLIPLPIELIKLISPLTFEDKRAICEFQKNYLNSFCNKEWITLSYYWFGGFDKLLKFLTYISIFFLLIHLIKKKNQLTILIYIIIISGLFEALIGKNPNFWWWANHINKSNHINGRYIASEHFASYMILIIPLTIGFLTARLKKLSSKKSIIERFYKTIINSISEQSNPEAIFIMFCFIIMALRFFISGLRQGIVSLGCGLLFLSIFIIAKKKHKITGIFVIILSLFTLLYSNSKPLNDLNHPEYQANKKSFFKMINDYPFFGVGAGNFSHFSKKYMGDHDFNHNKNEYLKIVATMGYLGALIIIAGILFYFYKILGLFRERRNLYSIGICAGCMSGIMGILFYSLYNEIFLIPANSILLSSILATCFMAVHIGRKSSESHFFYKLIKIRLTFITKYSGALLIFFLWGTLIYTVMINLIAEANCPIQKIQGARIRPLMEKNIKNAIALNPNNSEYYYKMALYNMGRSAYSEKELEKNIKKTIENLQRAILLNPTRAMYWYDLGKQFSLLKKDSILYIDKYLRYSDKCFKKAYELAPYNADLLFEIGCYYIYRSKILKETDKTKPDYDSLNSVENDEIIHFAKNRSEGIKNFQRLFQRAIHLEPKIWSEAVDRVWQYYPKDSIIIGIIPKDNEEIKDRVLKRIVMKSEGKY